MRKVVLINLGCQQIIIQNLDSLFALIEETDSDEVVLQKHRVRKGESLWSIAIKYGSTITAICEVNKLNRNKPIGIGKVITVPIGSCISHLQKNTIIRLKKVIHFSEIAVKYSYICIKNKKMEWV